jgi:hypothetical protein
VIPWEGKAIKDADSLNDGWKALTSDMQTDTRFTEAERAGLVIINDLLDADGVTTKEQDMLVVSCMKKYCTQDVNYT